MTPHRARVVAFLASRPGHHSAEEIAGHLLDDGADVHRATVYRALDALAAAGVVAQVQPGHGAAAYHLAEPGDRHAHAWCRRCGRIVDLAPEHLAALQHVLDAEAGFALEVADVALAGLCASCR